MFFIEVTHARHSWGLRDEIGARGCSYLLFCFTCHAGCSLDLEGKCAHVADFLFRRNTVHYCEAYLINWRKCAQILMRCVSFMYFRTVDHEGLGEWAHISRDFHFFPRFSGRHEKYLVRDCGQIPTTLFSFPGYSSAVAPDVGCFGLLIVERTRYYRWAVAKLLLLASSNVGEMNPNTLMGTDMVS